MRLPPQFHVAVPLALTILFVLVGSAIVGQAKAMPAPVSVRAGEPVLALEPYAEMLEDASRKLTITEVSEPTRAWRRASAGGVNFGFSRSVWWVRFRLRNLSETAAASPIIEVGTPLQDYIEMFILRGRNDIVSNTKTGDRERFSSRPLKTRTFLFPVSLDPGGNVDIYCRFDTHDGLHEMLPLFLHQPGALIESKETETLALGMYYGCFAVLFFYNLFLFISTRTASFGWYTLYLIAFSSWSFTFRGHAFQYLWPEHPNLNNQALAFAVPFCYCANTVFSLAYLRTRALAPRWLYRATVVTGLLCGAAIVPALLDRYALSFLIGIPAEFFNMGCTFSTGILLAWKGYRHARYYVTARAAMACGVSLYYLRVLSILPASPLTEYGLQIGAALEMLLLGLGLADMMNTLKTEKIQAEHVALEAQTTLTTKLEVQVQERTEQLEFMNRQLSEMAITDELTGAFNLRHFNHVFPTELARGAPMTFCIFDFDYFKDYNDLYGHQQGNEALRVTSELVQANLRRADDWFFRLGGEEFGILIPASADMAVPFLDSLRQRIFDLEIKHEDNPYGVVTVSFGVACLPSPREPISADFVYAVADQLLYEAKARGRNRVRFRELPPVALPEDRNAIARETESWRERREATRQSSSRPEQPWPKT